MESVVENKTIRNVGIDFFRVISTFMVIFLHINGAGGILRNPLNTAWSPLWIIGSILQVLCVVAVNCFALISGYVNSGKKTKIKSIINLWLQAFFISVVVYIVKIALSVESFSLVTFIKQMLIITFNRWWYFTAYFLLFFFMPILNMAIEKCEKFLMGSLILAIGVIFCGIGYVTPFDIYGLISGYSFIWLAYLYLVGAYIKKHNFKLKIKGKEVKCSFYLFLYFAFSLLHLLIMTVISYLSGWKIVPVQANYIFVITTLASVSLLLFFANVKLKESKVLTFFSSTTFGVYLFHTAIGMTDRFAFLLNYHWIITIAGIFGFAIIIYLGCTLLEYLRQIVFKFCKIPNATDKIQNFLTKKYNDIKGKYE